MKLISELETKAAEYHADGDMDFSELLTSSATALRAAEKMAFELQALIPHLWYEGSAEKAALAEWRAATESSRNA